MFGTNIYYMAEIINNMVFISSVYSHTQSGYMFPLSYLQFSDGQINTYSYILKNKTVRIAEKMYQIYASMLCGTYNDIVNVYVFEQGSLSYFYPYLQLVYGYPSQKFNYNAGSYLYLQLGYVTSATCDHQTYISNVAVNFLYTALQDTMSSLESILSCFPGYIENNINTLVNNPYFFKGGLANQYIQYSDGNTWLNTQGNIIGDQNNLAYTYTNDLIVNRTTNQGRYFTHHSSGNCSFVSILDSGQVSSTDFFTVVFNVGYAGGENVLCHTDNGTFVVNNITYIYQWQIIYNACGNQSTSAPWVNTLIILQQNNVNGDPNPLFQQAFVSNCPSTNQDASELINQKVNNAAQRIHYIMYTNNCSSNYTPSSPPTIPLQIAQTYIQSITCQYTCQTCSCQNMNSCLTCLQTSFRTLNNTSCVCNQGYYDDGLQNTLCQACSYTCPNASCTVASSSSCLSCLASSFRILSFNSCLCISSYYDNGYDLACQACHHSCYNCTAGSSLNCTSCLVNSNRSFISNSCPCNDGYFDNGQNNCQACYYQCATCNQYSCITCPSSSQRTLESYQYLIYIIQLCTCNDGYFDNNTVNCVACSYTCATCSAATNQSCSTCNTSSNRTLISTTCPCNSGYFDDGQNATCQACSYTCATCTAANAQSCLSCSALSFRTQNISSCPCNSGYFDDGQNASCKSCSYTCATCTASNAQSCLSCPALSFRTQNISSCPCNSGYFDDGQNATCKACSYTCGTCTAANAQSCLSCSILSFRTQNINSCPCNSGFFEDGQNTSCKACSYTCATCTAANAQSCQSCSILSFRTQNINSCPCNSGYFEDGQNTSCKACSYTCATCTAANAQSCQSCSILSFRTQNINSCPCNSGYFEDGQNTSCKSCSYTCATCTAANAQSCLSCSTLSFRAFSNSSCPCASRYYDNTLANDYFGTIPIILHEASTIAICLKCHYSCQSCNDSTSQCISCSPTDFRKLKGTSPGLCECNIGYYDNGFSICILLNVVKSLAQIKPSCELKDCQQCQGDICNSCAQGYFLYENQCITCDKRCLSCSGTEINQCIECAYIQNQGLCKLCEEIKGLYTIGNKCESVCGDGIVHIEKEQCDDGNLKDNDGCSSFCKVDPIYIKAKLTIDIEQDLHSNLRSAVITFDKNYTQDFTLWQITIPSLDNPYSVNYTFRNNSLKITITLNTSLVNKKLLIIPDENSLLMDSQLQGLIPDYQVITQSEQKGTQASLDVNAVMVNIVAIILGFCILTGGFNMIWNLLDLFQTLSYLKYCNVQFPYNAEGYLDYMSNFNFKSITQYVPYVYEYSTNILGVYTQSNDTIAPRKMQNDGYSTLFLFNFICIITAWMGSLAIYIGCTIGLKITRKFNNLDNLDSYKGFKQKIYVFFFKFNQYLIACLRPFSEQFFYSGILRIFISTNYDMNFAIFLELRNFHFSNESPVLTFSSLAGICILTIQIMIIMKVQSTMQINTRKQLTKQDLMKKVGSMTEGLQKNYSILIKYFKVITLVKKILVMFALVCLYDHPIYQIGFISCLHLNLLVIYVYYTPLVEREEQMKCVSSEALVFLSFLVIHIFSFDQELKFLNQQNKSFLGWIIIGFCSSTIAIQIILDIKIQFRFFAEIYQKIKGIFQDRLSIQQGNEKQKKIKIVDLFVNDLE